jgi:hypothetical protein
MVCKSCGWNTTHITGHCDKWVAHPKSFSLPAPHLFWSESGKNPPEGGSGGSMTPTAAPTSTAASITSDRSLSSRVRPFIAQYKTNTEDGNFASFLADFEITLYCLQSIRWCSGIFGGLAGGSKGGYSPQRRHIQKPRPNHRRATCWRRRSVPYGLISRCRRRPIYRLPRLDGTFFLSSCSR